MISSVPSSSTFTECLPWDHVLVILGELNNLLQTIPPGSLPYSSPEDSVYSKLISFHPLPSDWLDDIGEVGTVNRQLEVIFGTRAFGFQLKERGPVLSTIIPILEFYLKKYPTDIIVQKWLLDLYHAACSAHSKAKAYAKEVPAKIIDVDLTGDPSDTESVELPSPMQVLDEIQVTHPAHSKRRRSGENNGSGDVQDLNTQPIIAQGAGKRRKAHKQRKGSKPTAEAANSALPLEEKAPNRCEGSPITAADDICWD
ncbi:hypothetical protein RSOLAG22IIIB_12879 [Rhizoctonia solani]|uniref:Uncharacterized protein n=1 Tax=Rhizoctonia solani TaxID=456999 RepID=A0A0K6GGZ2_9AGAM|nr:hypothetical protein RSOLAG22IIIB_12879 [Rhizoctonia solani]